MRTSMWLAVMGLAFLSACDGCEGGISIKHGDGKVYMKHGENTVYEEKLRVKVKETNKIDVEFGDPKEISDAGVDGKKPAE